MKQENEPSKLPMNAEETNTNNSQLISIEPIEDSPLTICGNEESGYFISLGMYKVTEPKLSKELALNELTKDFWNITVRIISACIDINNKQLKIESTPTLALNTETI